MGLVWTGTYPVDTRLQNSAVIKELINYFPDFAWTKFAYSVPAPMLLKGIQTKIQDSKTSSEVKKILTEIIAP